MEEAEGRVSIFKYQPNPNLFIHIFDEADEVLNHFFDDYYHQGGNDEVETKEEVESADEKDVQVTFKEVLE